jgi:glycosyltransferase involved in cell wall biosynthesis
MQPVPTPRAPAQRVAFVLGLATGGTVSHVIALAGGCRAAGLEVSVLGPPQTLALFGDDVDKLAVRIAERPHPAQDTAAIAGLRAALAGRRPDVVHAHGTRAGAFAALAIAALGNMGRPDARQHGPRQHGARQHGARQHGARQHGARQHGARRHGARQHGRYRPALVITVHNASPDGGLARLVYGLLERICARRADLVLCASADLLARMRSLGAAAEQFDVPALPAPPPTAADIATARNDVGAAGRPVVLAVARLAPQKGLDVLIDAAARWRGRDPRPRTVIAGDGPLAADLRAQASRSDADVKLLGARLDVPALLAVADVVVVPSRWEARALIIQEAMRAGRPIVATSVGGTPELTGSDGAILVPAGDPAALADAVAVVLDDASLAARLAAAAIARSAAFPSQQDAVAAALGSYARLAAAARKSRPRLAKLG